MRVLIILLCLISGSHTAFAQSEKLKAMEEELLFIQHTANQMWMNKSNTNYNSDDCFEQYINMVNLLCRQFDNMLNQMLIEDRDMTYPFTELLRETECYELLTTHAVWSADSLLRVFSWNLPGGTMYCYGNAVQYKNESSVVGSFSFDNQYNRDYDIQTQGSSYDTVYTLKDKYKTYYILSGCAQGSTRIVNYSLTAFSIQNELVMENIFGNKNGNYTNETSVGFDIGCGESDGGNFLYPIIEEENKVMNLPEMSDGCFTGKFIKYKFNGEKFKLISK